MVHLVLSRQQGGNGEAAEARNQPSAGYYRALQKARRLEASMRNQTEFVLHRMPSHIDNQSYKIIENDMADKAAIAGALRALRNVAWGSGTPLGNTPEGIVRATARAVTDIVNLFYIDGPVSRRSDASAEPAPVVRGGE